MVWHNNLLEAATAPAVTATTGFPPPSHNNLNGLDNQWNKYVNLEDFCQTAHTNDSSTVPSLHHIHHNLQFAPSSSHLDLDMDMMTSFNTSFDTMSASSPSVGATWSESSPEYETCRQHEEHGNSNNTSSSFNRPSTESNPSNDAQSFSPTSDASWGSSPAPVCVEFSSVFLSFVSICVSVSVSLLHSFSRYTTPIPSLFSLFIFIYKQTNIEHVTDQRLLPTADTGQLHGPSGHHCHHHYH